MSKKKFRKPTKKEPPLTTEQLKLVELAGLTKSLISNFDFDRTVTSDFEEINENIFKTAITVQGDAQMLLDELLDLEKKPNSPKLACKEGCSYCCHQRVAVSIFEAIAIAFYLKNVYFRTEDKISEFASKLQFLAAETSKMTISEWLKSGNKCPLLVDNYCSIYSIRPIQCRAYTSTDAKLCEQGLNDPDNTIITYSENHRSIADFADITLTIEIDKINLDARPVELVTALNILFNNKNAVGQWLNGEDIFEEAIMPLLADYAAHVPLPPIYQISKRKLPKRT